MTTYNRSGIYKPKVPYIGIAHIDYDVEPSTTQEALKIPYWHDAMGKEYEAQCKNNTWRLVMYEGQHIVDCRWEFKTKYKSNSFVE